MLDKKTDVGPHRRCVRLLRIAAAIFFRWHLLRAGQSLLQAGKGIDFQQRAFE